MKVHLIEDNLQDVRMIQKMLVSMDASEFSGEFFEFHHTENLADSIKAIEKNSIDVILLDLSLPDSQGLDTFRNAYTKCPQIPIIVLSGLDDQTVAIQAVRDGAQDYLVKGHVDSNLLVRSMQYAIERKHVQLEKEKIQEQLLQSQKMEAIGRLAGGIAHDFNNLMTAVQGFTDVITTKVNSNDVIFLPLKQIRLAASSAINMTRQMLMFSRNHPISFETLDLNKTITDHLIMLQRIIGEDIEVVTHLSPDLSMVRGDRCTLEQVLLNLAVNARDAMPSGGELIIYTENILVSDHEAKNHVNGKAGKFVKMTVMDNGVGIDKETLDHLFEPFYTTKSIGKGSGLGLSVVYGIVRQHEGWVTVHSEAGKGTAFAVYIPAVSQKCKDHSADSIESLSLDALQGEGNRVLIVEDAEGVREFAAMALRENGYQVFIATNVTEAIQLFNLEKGDFDLVITDVVLPDRSGLDLIQYFQNKNPSIRVLLSSGYTDQKLQWSLIQEKGYRFLQKPYSLSEFLNMVRQALDEIQMN
ncbi:response regulator [bacterium]|nr:response regulator [bacterium]